MKRTKEILGNLGTNGDDGEKKAEEEEQIFNGWLSWLAVSKSNSIFTFSSLYAIAFQCLLFRMDIICPFFDALKEFLKIVIKVDELIDEVNFIIKLATVCDVGFTVSALSFFVM